MAFVDELARDDLAAAVEVLFPENVEALADLRALAQEELPEAGDLADLANRLVARVTRVGAEVTELWCPDGPVLLRGADEVVDEAGVVHPVTRPVVAVCRCDKSQRLPWCDGTHKAVARARRRRAAASEARSGHDGTPGEVERDLPERA